MPALKVLHYPHKILRTTASPVTIFDEQLKNTIQQMFELMYAEEGVGLAATQVGLTTRFFVMDVSREQNQPLCLINPQIQDKAGSSESSEGCLSLPGIYAKVSRAQTLTVQYQDEKGDSHMMQAQGLAATCIQHEIDHLDGMVFIDHLSKLKQMLLLRKMKKAQLKTSET